MLIVDAEILKLQIRDTNLENHEKMAEYLLLLREVLPTAAVVIETDIHDHMSRQGLQPSFFPFLHCMRCLVYKLFSTLLMVVDASSLNIIEYNEMFI